MTDLHKYESYYYVHETGEGWDGSDSYLSLQRATEVAKDEAVSSGDNYEVTHVLTRTLVRVNVTVEVENL